MINILKEVARGKRGAKDLSYGEAGKVQYSAAQRLLLGRRRLDGH